jgi:predicted alpha/beta-fold hydrolase
MQQRAGAIASSFEPNSFHPWIFTTNSHVQTIGGFLLRDTTAAFLPRDDPIGAVSRIVQGIASKMLKHQPQHQQQHQASSRPKFWDVRERIETPDGDWFHADTLFPTTTSKEQERTDATVLLLHGLESNSDSALSQQMAAALAAQGMTVTCLNFRSCSQNEAGEFIPNDSLGGCE